MKHFTRHITVAGLLLFGCFSYAQNTPFSKASWISSAYKEDTVRRPCPIFKKSFRVNQTIRSAKLYITALGLYEAKLNGKRIGDAYFTPGFTSYNNRLQYQVYDVTKMISATNSIEVAVGEGWYRGVFRNIKSDSARNNYGAEAGLLAELVITYKDGRKNKIISDNSWSCAEGPIRYSELYDGEMFDAGFVVKDWSPVKILEHSKDNLIPSETKPVRKQETFKPAKLLITPAGDQVIDFGQNMAGWVRLKVKGKKGDTIRLSHAEALDKEGNFYTGNLRSAKATDTYILKGAGVETLEPHFTYHGFRYVKVEGCKAANRESLAVALYSDLTKTGTFECSDPMINRLQKNIEWSLNSNFFEIPTDCPQRSERLGWTGDAQIIAPTACYLRDVRSFYGKWLKDLAAEQGKKNGGVATFIPTGIPNRDSVRGVAAWGDAATIIPWKLYQVYGDTAILNQQYKSMKSWVEYIKSVSPNDLWKGWGYGDWYAQGDSTSIPLLDQCFYAWSTQLLINAATVLQKKEDVTTYTDLLQRVKQAFMRTYGAFDTKAFSTQTTYLLSLAFNMVPENEKQALAGKLAANIRSNNNHLATGLVGTPYLLPVLSQYGYTDLAYTLLKQTSCPSWLYPITKGATTIWEKWDAIKTDGSFDTCSLNHYSYGAVGQWLYESIAGIKAAAPGYKEIIIEPHVGGGLTWAKGSYVCRYGKIVSEWKLESGKVTIYVEIPKGTRATVYVPGKDHVEVTAGKYTFEGR